MSFVRRSALGQVPYRPPVMFPDPRAREAPPPGYVRIMEEIYRTIPPKLSPEAVMAHLPSYRPSAWATRLTAPTYQPPAGLYTGPFGRHGYQVPWPGAAAYSLRGLGQNGYPDAEALMRLKSAALGVTGAGRCEVKTQFDPLLFPDRRIGPDTYLHCKGPGALYWRTVGFEQTATEDPAGPAVSVPGYPVTLVPLRLKVAAPPAPPPPPPPPSVAPAPTNGVPTPAPTVPSNGYVRMPLPPPPVFERPLPHVFRPPPQIAIEVAEPVLVPWAPAPPPPARRPPPAARRVWWRRVPWWVWVAGGVLVVAATRRAS